VSTFEDGKEWLFDRLLNLMTVLNVPLNEDVSMDKVFSESKLKLVNVYSEFFLVGDKISESDQEKHHRLTTTLRLIFDTPTLNIKTPYIESVSVLSRAAAESNQLPEMSASTFTEDSGVELFDHEPGHEPCGYGDCPECTPEDCSPQCCCCTTIDVVSAISARCHRQVVVSCNEDGTGPGPGLDPFPDTCDICFDACDIVLGEIPGVGCDNLPDQDWWPFTFDAGGCECECREGFMKGEDCFLTCVQCENIFCDSVVEIETGDCSFEFTLTPDLGCCGEKPFADITFVIDDTGSMQGEIDNVKAGLQTIIDLLAESGAVARMSLVTYKIVNQIKQFGWNEDGTLAGTIIGGLATPPPGPLDVTENTDAFKDVLGDINASGGGNETLFDACNVAMNYVLPSSSRKLLFVVTDEPDWSTTTLDEVVEEALSKGYTIIYVGPFNGNQDIALLTGGFAFVLTNDTDFEAIFEEAAILGTVLPTSCDCLDLTPQRVRKATPECLIDDPAEECFQIPINKCIPDQECNCDLPFFLEMCGEIAVVTPETINQVCCSEVGGAGNNAGCDCPISEPFCCGVECTPVCNPDGTPAFPNLPAAQDAVWCECFDNAIGINIETTPNCEACCCPRTDTVGPGDSSYPCDQLDPGNPEHQELLNNDPPICCSCSTVNTDDCCNCELIFPDGTIISRTTIDQQVELIFTNCQLCPPGSSCIPCDDDSDCPDGEICVDCLFLDW